MVLIQADPLLDAAPQSVEDVGWGDFLADSATVPHRSLPQTDAPDPVVIFGEEHRLDFEFDLDLGVGEGLLQQVPDRVLQVVGLSWQLVALDVVSHYHPRRRREVDQLYGLYWPIGLHPHHHEAVAFGVIAFLDFSDLQVHPHLGHQRPQSQFQALQAGRARHVGAALDFDGLVVAQSCEDGDEALEHQGAAGRSGAFDPSGLTELWVDVDLGLPDLGHLFGEGREHRAQLVIDSRIGPFFANGVHPEALPEDLGEGEGGADHLPASFKQTAIDQHIIVHQCLSLYYKRIPIFFIR